mgnify:CR=1 FL=1
MSQNFLVLNLFSDLLPFCSSRRVFEISPAVIVFLVVVVLEDGSFLGCDESCGVVDAASSEVVVQICISLPLYVDDEFDNN